MRVLIIIVFFFVVQIETLLAHPVHVSICNIEIEQDSMSISFKLFKDDLQLGIEHNFGKYLSIDELVKTSDFRLIDDYIQAVFTISSNKMTKMKLNYINYELNEEAIWLNYKCYVSQLKKIQINNSIFLDLYYDQTNLLIINYHGKQNGYRFTYRNTDQQIDLR
ncbi:MAG: hypothetical protein K9H12_12050 [Bacteroidales bacterium]|nr:hypothetical protein [Bacteroidales bacterium]